jgi:hypothetical protein
MKLKCPQIKKKTNKHKQNKNIKNKNGTTELNQSKIPNFLKKNLAANYLNVSKMGHGVRL